MYFVSLRTRLPLFFSFSVSFFFNLPQHLTGMHICTAVNNEYKSESVLCTEVKKKKQIALKGRLVAHILSIILIFSFDFMFLVVDFTK